MKFTPFQTDINLIGPEDLSSLTDVSEGWYVEYKSQLINHRDLAKALSSFANQYGGWLFLGVTENKETHTAHKFPGIPNDAVQGGIEALRNAAKDIIRPPVFYNFRVFEGPVDAIGLKTGVSLIVVYVPQGPNSPYVHNDGRIYRRIADSSDPKPETDRATLDLLFQRGMQARSRLEDRIYRSPAISKGEGEQPYLHLFICSDPFEVLGHTYKGEFVDFSNAMMEKSWPFDNIFTSAEGFVARQTTNNSTYNRLLTWEFSRQCHSFVTCPVAVLQPDSANPIGDAYLEWINYMEEIRSQDLFSARILDLNYILMACSAVVGRHRQLVLDSNVSGPFFVKARLENVWRTVPFLDLPSYLAHIKKFGCPLVQDVDALVPVGTSVESFIQLDSTKPIDCQERISELVLDVKSGVTISLQVFNALGVSMWAFPKSGDGIYELFQRRMRAQEMLHRY